MIKSFPYLDGHLPTVDVRGFLTLPPAVQRPTLSGRIIWGIVGFMAGGFLIGGPMMFATAFMNDISKFGAVLSACVVLLAPWVGALWGATLLARSKAPKQYPALYDVSIYFGHDTLPVLLPPAELDKLQQARDAYARGDGDKLIQYRAGERRAEFRTSAIMALNIISRSGTLEERPGRVRPTSSQQESEDYYTRLEEDRHYDEAAGRGRSN